MGDFHGIPKANGTTVSPVRLARANDWVSTGGAAGESHYF